MLRRSVFCLAIFPIFWAPATASAAPPTPEQRRVDAAINRALEYLAKTQKPNGCWESDAYGESTATTSLGVMAFLAAGHVPGEGPYADNIDRGIQWVIDHQRTGQYDAGLIAFRTSHGPMYSHGVSTLMLAEVAGMVSKERAKPVRTALEKAIRVILNAQNVPKSERNNGGWRYQVRSSDSDLSVSGWQLLALRAAKNLGCDVPAENIDRAVAYIKRCSSAADGGFAYQPGGSVTSVRTGTGILALEICGEHHSQEALRGADYLLENPLDYDETYYFYGVYYCGVGMFQMGGKYWTAMQDQIRDVLLEKQSADGSWTAGNGSEKRIGRVYTTTMAVLSLAVEYQYLPIYQR
ncbi:Prenyltransferase and squalene oxidase repeat protein [Symmachiella macrocystis]|uniref:Prenyltransferase and squalene oxidase repeat protein n=1 Tax=Symmachiella macrocystis TaxID=2527985 RepID=A0A5C6BMH0_9PLAN|nr:prenyltransferase/squalene oxidase repeat-containing protein [Symmachiella macrocystis]TWU12651.1 Prenyltransferase and squalene oxidase repeat protein [Symmachiella macrocystis]